MTETRVRLPVIDGKVLGLFLSGAPEGLLRQERQATFALRPFTASDVDAIQSQTQDADLQHIVGTACQTANEAFIHAFSDIRLVKWVSDTLLEADIGLFLFSGPPDQVADTLHDFYARSPTTFSATLETAVERVARAGLDCWQNHSPEQLSSLLDVIDVFELSGLASSLLEFITSASINRSGEAWKEIRIEAIRVLAGLELPSTEAHLLSLMDDVRVTAPCYEALTFIDNDKSTSCFWRAASAALQDEEALLAVCRTLIQTPLPHRGQLIANVCRQLSLSRQDGADIAFAAVARALKEKADDYELVATGIYTARPMDVELSELSIRDLRDLNGEKVCITNDEELIQLALTVTHDIPSAVRGSIEGEVPEDAFP